MKASPLLIIPAFLAVLWWSARAAEQAPTPPVDAAIQVAQQGCCKAWDTYRRDWQVLYGFDYYACEAENARRDGDDVNQQSGEIWWDAYC